jgi:P-type Cu+ transporter
MVTKIAPTIDTDTNIDVVCGMKVEEDQAAGTSEYLGRTYYFCSEDCQHKFEQQPEFYMVKTGAGALGAPSLDEPL